MHVTRYPLLNIARVMVVVKLDPLGRTRMNCVSVFFFIMRIPELESGIFRPESLAGRNFETPFGRPPDHLYKHTYCYC